MLEDQKQPEGRSGDRFRFTCPGRATGGRESADMNDHADWRFVGTGDLLPQASHRFGRPQIALIPVAPKCLERVSRHHLANTVTFAPQGGEQRAGFLRSVTDDQNQML